MSDKISFNEVELDVETVRQKLKEHDRQAQSWILEPTQIGECTCRDLWAWRETGSKFLRLGIGMGPVQNGHLYSGLYTILTRAEIRLLIETLTNYLEGTA